MRWPGRIHIIRQQHCHHVTSAACSENISKYQKLSDKCVNSEAIRCNPILNRFRANVTAIKRALINILAMAKAPRSMSAASRIR